MTSIIEELEKKEAKPERVVERNVLMLSTPEASLQLVKELMCC
jgi:hypothetical protein